MKYEETCACGTTMKMEDMDAPELARAKAQWKIDHGPHGDNTITIERKRALLEYNDLRARVKTAEDKAYPAATVLAYAVSIVDRKGGANMYQGLVDPGNGFQWEDPNSSIIVSIQPATMKLPDLAPAPWQVAKVRNLNPCTSPVALKNPCCSFFYLNRHIIKELG